MGDCQNYFNLKLNYTRFELTSCLSWEPQIRGPNSQKVDECESPSSTNYYNLFKVMSVFGLNFSLCFHNIQYPFWEIIGVCVIAGLSFIAILTANRPIYVMWRDMGQRLILILTHPAPLSHLSQRLKCVARPRRPPERLSGGDRWWWWGTCSL